MKYIPSFHIRLLIYLFILSLGLLWHARALRALETERNDHVLLAEAMQARVGVELCYRATGSYPVGAQVGQALMLEDFTCVAEWPEGVSYSAYDTIANKYYDYRMTVEVSAGSVVYGPMAR